MTRHIAHITFESATPLKVGSNNRDFLQDSPIQRDWNELPMILGTSLAGVLRKAFSHIASAQAVDEIFGGECGSKIILSNALLLDENNQVCETLLTHKSNFLEYFSALPIREHTALTHKGVVKEHSKFDEEIVYKGARFKFRLEMKAQTQEHTQSFFQILDLLYLDTFRIGGGSTKGRGKIKILNIAYDTFSENDEAYINLSSSLNQPLAQAYTPQQSLKQSTHDIYELTLIPESFFIFGSGGGDDDADHIGLEEYVIDYTKQGITEHKLVIPASAVKGALSHRTTFYYNALKQNFIDTQSEQPESQNGEIAPQQSVAEIFGSKKGDKGEIESKGKILLVDMYYDKAKGKTFPHIKIDNFTGGGIDGALFQEKVDTLKSFKLKIWLEKGIDKTALEAFEHALCDIANGLLALGGASAKGHGYFQGSITKNGENYDTSRF